MKHNLKIRNMEYYFPYLAFENGCILTKQADVTIAFRLTLPEIFTLTESEYDEIHSAWSKAIKVLPVHTIFHKQDWYKEAHYEPSLNGEDDFFTRANKLHFNERPFLFHESYLFLTLTTKKRMEGQSVASSLCKGKIIPAEINPDRVASFVDVVAQFERIINDTGFFNLERLTETEFFGDKDKPGLLDKYFFFVENDGSMVAKDICLDPSDFRIGDTSLQFHSLSNPEQLPGILHNCHRYEPLSTDRSDTILSYSHKVGLGLYKNHVYNQILFIDDSAENIRKFERSSRQMRSFSAASRENALNEEFVHAYLNTAHTYGAPSIRAAFNVMSWHEDKTSLKAIGNEVGSSFASMECTPSSNKIDAPLLYWGCMPGNTGDFPAEETFYTFPDQALCLLTNETNYRSSTSSFGIKMADRNGVPIHIDISDLPLKKGIINNRNKFILGPSGSGKSFFTNHMVRQYYAQGAHIVLVDTGDSYQGLCNLIREETKGNDGIYKTYTPEAPISFNPFYTKDYVFDIEKKDSLKTLLITLWKGDKELNKTEVSELDTSLNEYIELIRKDRSIRPCFNTYYEYVRDVYRPSLKERDIEVRREYFDADEYLIALKRYYRGGVYDFLLNSEENIDFLDKRFIVFEIDSIKDNADLFPVVTIIIMEAFINKMRRLKGIRKMILIEEAWKAIASANMATYIQYLYKTVRKHFGEAIVVTQEVDDIIKSKIVKESIINNSDCKILLDQRKYMNKFEGIQEMLGLTDKEKSQILSINANNDPKRKYKEVWIGLGGQHSAVYATEVSMEEYLAFTTESIEKVEVMELAKVTGSIRSAIRQLALKYKSK